MSEQEKINELAWKQLRYRNEELSLRRDIQTARDLFSHHEGAWIQQASMREHLEEKIREREMYLIELQDEIIKYSKMINPTIKSQTIK